MVDETSKVSVLKGIGEKTEKLLNKLNIFQIQDLIEYYPRDYEEYKPPTFIKDIKEDEVFSISATVVKSVQIKKVKNLQIISCVVKDSTGLLTLKWFNMPFLKSTLRIGYNFIFRGKVIRKENALILEHPMILTKEEYIKKIEVLQAIYPLTFGLTNNTISKAIKQALETTSLKEDYLPKSIREKYCLAEERFSLQEIHLPQNKDNLLMARKRLVFDEFFLFTLAIKKLRQKKEEWFSSYIMKPCKESSLLIDSLPYTLTNAQISTWKEIEKDLLGNILMNRLVQGDVGSGKTIVAVLAILLTIQNGYQAALMVPTEVLAKQHYISVSALLESFGGKVVLLVGSMTAKEKKNIYDRIATNQCNVIIGTHALIQEKVTYSDLALVITDEQHRFGVRQRESLAQKGVNPHILVMSATPIPRTLAVILYGDLDISIINELPAQKLPIKNCVVDTSYRPTAYKFIEKEVLNNRQAYVICPMVEENESVEAENVIEYTQTLKENLLPYIKVEYLHGKMKAKEKNDIMERFAANEIHVLVSTTVIEVGINVPNATVIMIEDANRFGLAQLHQLRGRVGRGKYQSYCIFVSGSKNKETMERLEILNKSNDGFFIAAEDLKLRGSGDLFGIRQSGLMEFKIGDVLNDSNMLKLASEASDNLINEGIFDDDLNDGLDNGIDDKLYIKLKEKLDRYLSDGINKLNI